MSPRARRAALLAAWLAAVFVLQELALRFAFPLPEIASLNRADYMRRPPGDPRRPLRSLRIVWESAPDAAHFEHSLNAYGFRDREWRLAREPGVARVLFAGDSFVEGTMARDEETIPRRFEAQAARAGRRVEAMNFGVMGAELSHYFQLVDDAAPLFRPDAVILVLFANDLPPPAFDVERAPARRFDPLLPRLVEVGRMLAAGEMPPLRLRLRAVSYHVPASDPRHLWHGREAEVLARARPDLARAVIEGRFNPYRVGGSSHLAEALRTPIELERPLRFLDRVAARSGGRLFVAYLPDRTQVSDGYAAFEAALGADGPDLHAPEFQRHASELARDCAAAGVPFLDLSPALREAEAGGRRLYWNYDDHMRAEGYALVARELFAWWSSAAAPAARERSGSERHPGHPRQQERRSDAEGERDETARR
jgi:lysophospholipase L1-like esterase